MASDASKYRSNKVAEKYQKKNFETAVREAIQIKEKQLLKERARVVSELKNNTEGKIEVKTKEQTREIQMFKAQREELVLRAEELQLKYSQALENDVPKPLGKVTLVDPTEERIRVVRESAAKELEEVIALEKAKWEEKRRVILIEAVEEKEKAMLAERQRLMDAKEEELAALDDDDADDATKIAQLEEAIETGKRKQREDVEMSIAELKENMLKQRAEVMASALEEQKLAMQKERARLKVEWREDQMGERMIVLQEQSELFGGKENEIMDKIKRVEAGDTVESSHLIEMEAEEAESKAQLARYDRELEEKLNAEKDQHETAKVHRLEELEEKLAEIEQKEIERHVHEKEEQMLNERRRLIEEKEREIAEDAAEDSNEEEKIEKLKVKLEEIKVSSVEEREKEVEEQKKNMLKERAEIKAQELTDLEHSMLRKRQQILLELENNLKEERRKAVKENQQKIDQKRDALEKHLQELRKERADLEAAEKPPPGRGKAPPAKAASPPQSGKLGFFQRVENAVDERI